MQFPAMLQVVMTIFQTMNYNSNPQSLVSHWIQEWMIKQKIVYPLESIFLIGSFVAVIAWFFVYFLCFFVPKILREILRGFLTSRLESKGFRSVRLPVKADRGFHLSSSSRKQGSFTTVKCAHIAPLFFFLLTPRLSPSIKSY